MLVPDGLGDLSLGLLRLSSRSCAPLPLHVSCQPASRLTDLVMRGSIPCATKLSAELLQNCPCHDRELMTCCANTHGVEAGEGWQSDHTTLRQS